MAKFVLNQGANFPLKTFESWTRFVFLVLNFILYLGNKVSVNILKISKSDAVRASYVRACCSHYFLFTSSDLEIKLRKKIGFDESLLYKKNHPSHHLTPS